MCQILHRTEVLLQEFARVIRTVMINSIQLHQTINYLAIYDMSEKLSFKILSDTQSVGLYRKQTGALSSVTECVICLMILILIFM
jgi:hypothetical protein